MSLNDGFKPTRVFIYKFDIDVSSGWVEGLKLEIIFLNYLLKESPAVPTPSGDSFSL